eukprot:CAMPEP_0117447248 /NCGR_PEP_ID=MMETSP0759-20121206/6772_1 /TAXON_ID=63605 /ORGANISM="Percolomonas cosmopolitus, Strain WS" /LENGTH=86 /DNA_ID=CAMNT_0005239567 /DNA_START=49 /DNA_END=309 /DNA_ORIENTATION=+
MTTKKLGITGKYGTRYGANLRKRAKKYEESKRSRHFCHFCGKYQFKRRAVGIWDCKNCGKSYAGGAWSLHTSTGTTTRSTIRRLRE